MDGFGVTDATEVTNCAELTAAEVAKQLESTTPLNRECCPTG